MPATTDLTTATDIELDAALAIGYRQHRDATKQERAEVHAAIVAVLGEQARRRDAWINEREASHA